MKRYSVLTLISIMLTTFAHLSVAENTDLTAEEIGLRDAHRKYMKAWSDHDIDTIVEMGTGAAGFGHSTAFPRPVREKDKFRAGVTKFYEMMDVFKVNIITENYRVVGDTGMAWGHISYITKQKDGPQREVYQRYTHIFSNVTGKWTLVMYHRSIMTSEDFQ